MWAWKCFDLKALKGSWLRTAQCQKVSVTVVARWLSIDAVEVQVILEAATVGM